MILPRTKMPYLLPLLLALTACAAPINAPVSPSGTAYSAKGGASESLRQRLIGAWKLVAIRDRDAATGIETPAARAADSGQLIYTANGRLSVQIVRVGRETAPPGSADGFSSYFGRWELVTDGGYVIHHQDGNLALAQVGQAAKRYYSFDSEGRLSLATPPRKQDDGREVSSVFVWEKFP
jgi:amidase